MRKIPGTAFKRLQVERAPMTVCVAAICQGTTIFGASDRLVTVPYFQQHEPKQAKRIELTNSICVLISGDLPLQTEIGHTLLATVRRRLAEDIASWLPVADAADMYSKCYNAIAKVWAERAILARQGLDWESFFANQRLLAPEFVEKLQRDLADYEMPGVSALVVGCDTSGAHIYECENSSVTCADLAGCAAIGTGAWHATSYLMQTRHTGQSPLAQTVLRTYAAKKRAEVAPGVGSATDMFTIGPLLGSYQRFSEDDLAPITRIYDTVSKKHQTVDTEADKVITKHVEALLAARAARAQGPPKEEDNGTGAPH